MPVTSSKNGFQPVSPAAGPALFGLPDEPWVSVLQTPCTFSPPFFLQVMHSLIQNPNLSSSYLFRAEIFYDSFNDVSVSLSAYHSPDEPFSKFERHMKQDYRPRRCQQIPGFAWQRTWVRKLVPRNPNLDKDLVQTCHAFVSDQRSRGDDIAKEVNLIVYLPHVDSPDQMPWYHPSVSALAFEHTWLGEPSEVGSSSKLESETKVETDGEENESTSEPQGTIRIHYRLFPNTTLETRLERIALNLLSLIHRHGTGHAAGYTKRVQHDRLVPQAIFQDRYTELKARYAKSLIKDWVEQTDPAKHVFEDLGIAAFLIELWREMYGDGERGGANFPGFVDIGCGNGVLVYILLSEGYKGWGFDARQRKTWNTFPPEVKDKLKEMILVPEMMMNSIEDSNAAKAAHDSVPSITTEPKPSIPFHPGSFPDGTFIISNHADELTGWTPLLAHLCKSPFIAIPCCSHNLDGARFRAPAAYAAAINTDNPSQASKSNSGSNASKNPKPPSAYATLCGWVTKLAEDVRFSPEKEMLRIPSTRNAAIIGRKNNPDEKDSTDSRQERTDKVREILEREMGMELDVISKQWVERAWKIAGGQGSGH